MGREMVVRFSMSRYEYPWISFGVSLCLCTTLRGQSRAELRYMRHHSSRDETVSRV